MPRIRALLTLSTVALLPASGAVAADTPPSTTPDGGYEHATGPDDVVMEISFAGGLVPTDIAFVATPSLVVTGDGRLIEEGPFSTIFPGPLLPNIQQRTISEDGIQEYLELADVYGMLADRQYEGNDLVLDAAVTILTITVGDRTFVHAAYALGLGTGPDGSETDPDRADFHDFVTLALDPERAVDEEELGPIEPFESDSYLVQARISEGLEYGPDSKPTLVDWPADASVRLADASACAEVPVDDVGSVLGDADQLTLFIDEDETYHVAATLRPPGRHC